MRFSKILTCEVRCFDNLFLFVGIPSPFQWGGSPCPSVNLEIEENMKSWDITVFLRKHSSQTWYSQVPSPSHNRCLQVQQFPFLKSPQRRQGQLLLTLNGSRGWVSAQVASPCERSDTFNVWSQPWCPIILIKSVTAIHRCCLPLWELLNSSFWQNCTIKSSM